jgi:hypothetical protein
MLYEGHVIYCTALSAEPGAAISASPGNSLASLPSRLGFLVVMVLKLKLGTLPVLPVGRCLFGTNYLITL